MVKTDKSSLQHKLEEHQSCLTPDNLPSITASVIDGGYLLHSVLSKVTKRSSFGDIAHTRISKWNALVIQRWTGSLIGLLHCKETMGI